MHARAYAHKRVDANKHARVYAFMYTHICICTRNTKVYTDLDDNVLGLSCLHLFLCVPVLCVCMHVYINVYGRACVHMYVIMYACAFLRMRACALTQIDTYTNRSPSRYNLDLNSISGVPPLVHAGGLTSCNNRVVAGKASKQNVTHESSSSALLSAPHLRSILNSPPATSQAAVGISLNSLRGESGSNMSLVISLDVSNGCPILFEFAYHNDFQFSY